MKKIILSAGIATTVLISAHLPAQSISASKIPPVVTSALKSKYPAATKITWEKEKGNYEANWGGRSGEDMSVQFTPAGIFIEQVQAIAATGLPVNVKNYVAAHYKGAKISEAGKITDAKGTTMYEAEVRGKDLVFDENGNFLKID